MSQSEDAAVAENRFAHLLQPIRDLAQNWNIDIAKELEEYLGELGEITYSQLDGLQAPNFAEGSASIYSRKVEYLYTLSYRALENLIDRKKKKAAEQKQSSIQPDGTDADLVADEEPELLPLDDLEEDKNINMNESAPSVLEKDLRENINLARATSALTFALAPIGGQEIGYQMNGCTISASGALLLGQTAEFLNMEYGGLPTISLDFEREGYDIRGTRTINPEAPRGDSVLGLAPKSTDMPIPVPIELPLPTNVPAQAAPPLQVIPLQPDESDDEEAEDEEGEKKQEKLKKADVEVLNRAIQAAEVNPWDLVLDPYDTTHVVPRPFVKGKTYRVPLSLQKEKEKDKDKPKINTLPVKGEEFPADYDSPRVVSDKITTGSYMTRPIFPEFQYIYDAEMKQRAKGRKEQKKAYYKQIMEQRGINVSDFDRVVAVAADEAVVEPESEILDGDRPIELDADAEDGGDDFGDLPANSQSINSQLPEETTDMLGLSSLGSNSDLSLVETYEDLCKAHFDRYVNEAQNYAEEASEVNRNVHNWKGRLQPMLEAQERRRQFNMKSYASRVIKLFDNSYEDQNDEDVEEDVADMANMEKFVGQEKDFTQFLENQPQYEVCRRFLTALHLANSHNIELVVEPRKSHNKMNKQGDLIRCKLLSTAPPVDIEAAFSIAHSPKKIEPMLTVVEKEVEEKDGEEEEAEEEEEDEAEIIEPRKKGRGQKRGRTKTQEKGRKKPRKEEEEEEDDIEEPTDEEGEPKKRGKQRGKKVQRKIITGGKKSKEKTKQKAKEKEKERKVEENEEEKEEDEGSVEEIAKMPKTPQSILRKNTLKKTKSPTSRKSRRVRFSTTNKENENINVSS